MWRPEQLLEVGRQVRLGEKREDAATVVVDDDDRDPQRMQAGRHERVEVVEERQVANDEDDRAGGDGRGAQGARDDPVDTVRASVREAANEPLVPSPHVIQVADGHAVADIERRSTRQERRERREDAPFEGVAGLTALREVLRGGAGEGELAARGLVAYLVEGIAPHLAAELKRVPAPYFGEPVRSHIGVIRLEGDQRGGADGKVIEMDLRHILRKPGSSIRNDAALSAAPRPIPACVGPGAPNILPRNAQLQP